MCVGQGRGLVVAGMFTLCTGAASAQSLVVLQGSDLNYYGSATWTDMSALIDAGFGQVTVANVLESSALTGADALWIDQRGAFNTLTSGELGVLQDYIASGRRVVIMGENVLWTDWNNQILGLLGGSFVGGTVFGTMTPTGAAPELTDGVSGVDLFSSGIAEGGVALFDQNWATLWGSNVLTMLDTNPFDNIRFDGNRPFAENVVSWLAVPAPGTAGAMGFGLMLGASRRRRG